TGICLDASTEIYGKQRNPLDAKRLAGGSSTGEAILLVKDGSPLGFGTDIAGSIRIPSAFCGICGLKLTSNRISTIGLRSVAEDGFAHIHPVFGPMAKCTSLLADAMKAILCSAMFELDPRVPELPFNDRIYSGTEPLVIGYCACIGEELAVRPVVAVEAAMHKVISLLRSKGHKLVKFNIPDPDKLISMSSTAMFANGGASLRKAVQDDPANSRLRLLCFALSLPVFIRRSVAWLIHRFISRPIGATIRSSTGCQSTQDVLFLLNEISGYQVEFAKAWSEAKLDVLICPGMPFPAPLDTTPDLLISGLTNYVLPYNVLDYPAGVLPVAK
uniref:Amidase domain-containing protein n=1 Tax=Mesocestoides corti TaxID=53468 RepID=A0A5K3G2Q1_MESCO